MLTRCFADISDWNRYTRPRLNKLAPTIVVMCVVLSGQAMCQIRTFKCNVGLETSIEIAGPSNLKHGEPSRFVNLDKPPIIVQIGPNNDDKARECVLDTFTDTSDGDKCHLPFKTQVTWHSQTVTMFGSAINVYSKYIPYTYLYLDGAGGQSPDYVFSLPAAGGNYIVVDTGSCQEISWH